MKLKLSQRRRICFPFKCESSRASSSPLVQVDLCPALLLESTALSPQWSCLAEVTDLVPLILESATYTPFTCCWYQTCRLFLMIALRQYRIVLMDVQPCGDKCKRTLLWGLCVVPPCISALCRSQRHPLPCPPLACVFLRVEGNPKQSGKDA